MDEQQAWAVLRRQRHSFLNHLQVISGWLQMNQPDRARRYLEMVAEDISAVAHASRSVPPEMGLAFLDLALEAETHGARLDWRIVGAIAPIDLEALKAAVVKGCGAVAQLSDNQRIVTVLVGSTGFAIHTPLDSSEG